MAEITSGIRSLLHHPLVYQAVQWVLGANKLRRHVTALIHPYPGQKVLDLGCGPADLLAYLPEVTYTGLDSSPAYIGAARRRFGQRAYFLQATLEADTAIDLGLFDCVVAIGLLHHLDDESALQLFKMARQCLSPQGHLITVDCCWSEEQHWLARWLITRDRGQNIRYLEGYKHLASAQFSRVEASCHHDLLRLPYSHTIMVCRPD